MSLEAGQEEVYVGEARMVSCTSSTHHSMIESLISSNHHMTATLTQPLSLLSFNLYRSQDTGLISLN